MSKMCSAELFLLLPKDAGCVREIKSWVEFYCISNTRDHGCCKSRLLRGAFKSRTSKLKQFRLQTFIDIYFPRGTPSNKIFFVFKCFITMCRIKSINKSLTFCHFVRVKINYCLGPLGVPHIPLWDHWPIEGGQNKNCCGFVAAKS